jgi:chromosome transmission fidelity protein 18
MALVIPFPPTGSSKLAARLKEVAAAEDMKADLTALLTLCKKTDNDIRSCLSSLQFFRKRSRVLHSADVADLAVGSKDSQKSLFSVWDDVFTMPRIEGGQQGGACKNNIVSGKALRFNHVLESISSCGEYDRVLTGQG